VDRIEKLSNGLGGDIKKLTDHSQDLYELRLAREENKGERTYTIEEVRKELGIE
jgi:hypothetical protein